jgi:regulator of sigma E protease
MIETLLLFVISMMVVVIAHEFGHFIVAKRTGVVVEEFGIGFPPRLFGHMWRGTLYSVNALPVGAFVKSRSENDPLAEGSLASKGPWTRFAVYAAGPVVNIILAFLLFTTYFGLPQATVVSDGVLVYQVQADSPAGSAGLVPGDVIVRVDGEMMDTWQELHSALAGASPQDVLQLEVLRDGASVSVSVSPRYSEELGRNAIGIVISQNLVRAVQPDSLAAGAGILAGDSLLGVNGKGLIDQKALDEMLASSDASSPVVLTLLRDSSSYTAEFTSAQMAAQPLGLQLQWAPGTRVEYRSTPVAAAAIAGARLMLSVPSLIVSSVPLMQEDPSLAFVGPIGAGQLTVEAVRVFGASNLIFIGGLISLGIALFNLLPVPPLDGGGMLVALVEAARRGRRLSERAIRVAYAVGTALLITVVIFATTSDILRIVQGRDFGL